MASNDRRISQYHIDAFRINEINEFREEMGLKPLDTKKRNCLRCDKEFLSFGYQNKMCDHCRLRDYGLEGYYDN